MGQKITWTEPERPEIPATWAVIINGNVGTAYEDIEDYNHDIQLIDNENLEDNG